jgi:tetratricopeptide (TPR) repeat protein
VNCLLVVFFLFFAAAESWGAESSLWGDANRAYAEGKFEEAKVDYLQLVSQGNRSPELFFNLGNTYLKLDDKGRAALNFKRALAVDPGLQPAKRNLALALQAAGAEPESGTVSDWFANYPDWWLLIGSISFWILIYTCYLRLISKRFRPLSTAVLTVAIPCTWLFLGLAFWVGDGVKARDLGFIINSSADVHYGPANGARVLETLGLGEPIHIVSERGAWTLCHTDSGSAGWIPSNSIERLVPE